MTMNFAVYTRSGCPYCDKVKQVLDAKKKSYQEYRLGEHFDREKFDQEFGKGATFPQVLMNEKKLGGCSDSIKYLRENKLI